MKQRGGRSQSTPRFPREAKSLMPKGHRLQPHDQYYTPRGAVMALLRVSGNDILKVYEGNIFINCFNKTYRNIYFRFKQEAFF